MTFNKLQYVNNIFIFCFHISKNCDKRRENRIPNAISIRIAPTMLEPNPAPRPTKSPKRKNPPNALMFGGFLRAV